MMAAMSSEADEKTPAAATLSRSLVRRLSGVTDARLRTQLVLEYCINNEADHAVAGLEALVADAVAGEGRGAWLAVAMALCSARIPYHVVGDLYRAAVDGGHDATRLLLIAGDSVHKRADDREFAIDDLIENLTLGERKAKARTFDKDLLTRLMFDPDASVIRVLLRNPRLTERDVLRLASRRPNRPAALREIARVPRWLCRPAVQRSLILNPYSPVRLTVTLLPLMSPSELVEVSKDRSLHRLTATAARVLLDVRGWQRPTFH